jgi:hypothetical protein
MTTITPQMVVDHYSSLALEEGTKNYEHIRKVAESFGYAPEDLAGIPEGANLGVSCGNPLAVAGLKPVCLSLLIPSSVPSLELHTKTFTRKEPSHGHVLNPFSFPLSFPLCCSSNSTR